MHCRLELLRLLRGWKTPYPKNKLNFSLHYRTLVFYTAASLLLASALIFTGIIDLILLLGLEKPELTTHSSLVTVMLLHCISFYLSLFGFIHSFEAGLYTLTNLSILSGGLSLVSLLLRIIQELTLAGFYPSEYAVS